MSQERISDMPLAGTLLDAMLVPVVDMTQPSGERSRQSTVSAISSKVQSDIASNTGLQPASAELTALAAAGGTGVMVRSGSATYAYRTLTGTANEVTVTFGDGTGGNPTLSLPAAITLTGKTLTGGTLAALTALGIRSTGAAFDLQVASSEVLTANRKLSIVLGDAARTLTLGASPSLSGSNTGDQTITLTGDVTGSGSGSFAASIGSAVIMHGMLNVDAITGMAANNSPNASNDYLLYYSASAGGLRKVTVGSIAGALTSGVATFNGRSGTVVPVANDYNFTDLAGTIAVAQFPAAVVTYAKIQNVSATDKVLGRSTAGAGVMEEIPCTASGRAMIAAASATAQTALLDASTTTTKGIVELAINTEVTTGTDATRAVSPDSFAHSDYGKRVVQIQVTDPNGSAITTGEGKAKMRVNSVINGYNLVGVAANVDTVSSSGLPTIGIRRKRSGSDVEMLSTALTIDANERDSSTAATAAVINLSNDDVTTADEIFVDIDTAGTGAKGLIVDLTFQLP